MEQGIDLLVTVSYPVKYIRYGFESIHNVWSGLIECFVLFTFPVDYKPASTHEDATTEKLKDDWSITEIEQHARGWHRQEADLEIGRCECCFTIVGYVRRTPSHYTPLVSCSSQQFMRHSLLSIVEQNWRNLPIICSLLLIYFWSIIQGKQVFTYAKYRDRESRLFRHWSTEVGIIDKYRVGITVLKGQTLDECLARRCRVKGKQRWPKAGHGISITESKKDILRLCLRVIVFGRVSGEGLTSLPPRIVTVNGKVAVMLPLKNPTFFNCSSF